MGGRDRRLVELELERNLHLRQQWGRLAVGTHGATLEKEAYHVELAAAGGLVQWRPSPRLLLVQLPLSPLPNALLYPMNVALACEGRPMGDKALENHGNACRAMQEQAALIGGGGEVLWTSSVPAAATTLCLPPIARKPQSGLWSGRPLTNQVIHPTGEHVLPLISFLIAFRKFDERPEFEARLFFDRAVVTPTPRGGVLPAFIVRQQVALCANKHTRVNAFGCPIPV